MAVFSMPMSLISNHRLRVLAGVLVSLSACARPSVTASPTRAVHGQIVTMDFVRAKDGQRDRLIRFYQLNWSKARAIVLAQGGIAEYKLLVSADIQNSWDVALLTVYADSSRYARREEVFQPVLRSLGRLTIDGFDRAALGEIVEGRVLSIVDPR